LKSQKLCASLLKTNIHHPDDRIARAELAVTAESYRPELKPFLSTLLLASTSDNIEIKILNGSNNECSFKQSKALKTEVINRILSTLEIADQKPMKLQDNLDHSHKALLKSKHGIVTTVFLLTG